MLPAMCMRIIEILSRFAAPPAATSDSNHALSQRGPRRVLWLCSRFNILPQPPITPKTNSHIPKKIRREQEKAAKSFSTMPTFVSSAFLHPLPGPLPPFGLALSWARQALQRVGLR